MGHIGTILVREYLERVRKRSFLIGTILGPLFMIGLMVLPALLMTRGTQDTLRVTVIDETNTLFQPLREALNDTLRNGLPRFDFEPAAVAGAVGDTLPAEVTQALESERVDICLVIPSAIYDEGQTRYYSKKVGDEDVIGDIRRAMTGLVTRERLESQGFNSDRIAALTRPVGLKSFKIRGGETREAGFELDFLGSLLFVFFTYTMLLIYGNTIQSSIIEEKGTRIIEVLLSATTPIRMLWGKILGVGSVSLTQMGIWAISGLIITQAPMLKSRLPGGTEIIPPSAFVYFVVFFILGFFLYSSLYAAIGSMVNSTQEAQQIQFPVVVLIIASLMLSFSVRNDPTSPLATITSLIPFFAPIVMLMRVNLYEVPPQELVLCVVLLLLAIALTVYVTARIYRVGILMYGKRPTLPELMRWLRQK